MIILKIDEHGHCPNCGESWDAGPVHQEHIDKGYYKPGTHYSKLIGIELQYPDPNSYDGVCMWQCPFCGQNWCRWCGEKLEVGESHPPFHNVSFDDAKEEVFKRYDTALRNLANS